MIPARFAPVLAELAPLAERFAAAGHRLYLVGGTVRDLLLGGDGRRLTTSTSPPTPGRRRSRRCSRGWADAVWTQGERFGTIGARRDRPDGTTRTVEITTFRAEALRRRLAQAATSRSPTTIEADLGRRDFTINAMALELTATRRRRRSSTRTAAPPTSPRRRCARRWPPEISFDDDPLRMLRAARFIARFGLHAGARAGRRGASSAASGWRSCRPSGSATSSTS